MKFTSSSTLAETSLDHVVPWGTRKCLSVNKRFIEKLCALYGKGAIFSLLDLGCAGGHFVSECVERGINSAGIEGSDWSQKQGRGAWRIHGDKLFVSDITKPFSFDTSFDVITAWEVVEHLTEDGVGSFFQNAANASSQNTLLIISTTSEPDFVNGVNLHQTMKGHEWWIKAARKHGWENSTKLVKYFSPQWNNGSRWESDSAFHFVFHRKSATLPKIPKQSFMLNVYDIYLGSNLQKFIAGKREHIY
jgi:SAM-dependent methyltransferase